jgi:hypothetical protein
MSVGNIDPGQAVYAQDEVRPCEKLEGVKALIYRMEDRSLLFGKYYVLRLNAVDLTIQ